MAETETTWDAYDVFLLRLDIPPERRGSAEADPGPDAITRPTPPYSPPDRGWGHAGYPAVGVTFNAATQYCRWLSQSTGRHYRLPTVAEWQHACRASVENKQRDVPVAARAWCAENSDEKTHAVATKLPDGFGLHDMLGNVAEWCIDADGSPVVCGGSFQTPPDQLSCTLIERPSPDWQASDPSFPRSKWWLADAPLVGFRVVCHGP